MLAGRQVSESEDCPNPGARASCPQGSGSRTGTRRKIQEAALALFAERGYEKTSLREIAQMLEVSKAALYYHFRTKEDIVASLLDDFLAGVDQIIAWGRTHSAEDATHARQELIHRYAAMLGGPGGATIRFLHGNQTATRDLRRSDEVSTRFSMLARLLSGPDAPPAQQLRASIAISALHAGFFAPIELNLTDEERRAAAIDIAFGLVAGD